MGRQQRNALFLKAKCLKYNQPAFVQDSLGPGRSLPLGQTPDLARTLEARLLAVPPSLPRGQSPSQAFLARNLAPLQLDAAISIFFKASGSTHRF